MKKSFYVQLLSGLAFFLFSEMSFAGHFKTVWSGNPYNPMNFVIQKATINGSNMIAGDEIAVFDVDGNGNEICVGVTVLSQQITSSKPATLVAGEDDGSGQPNGFIPGHKIIFRLWDSQNSREITSVIPTYNLSFDTAYKDRGTAVVTSLAGFSNIETYIDSLATCPGQVVIPIKVKNMNQVGSFSLVLNTDTAFFHYTGYQDVNTALSGNVTVQDNSGSINISWASTQAATIDTGTLIKLKFDVDTVYAQTTKDFSWDKQDSYYKTGDGTKLGIDFTDGKVTIHPLPVAPDTIIGQDSLYKGSKNITYKISKLNNATSYAWSLSPAYAGTLTVNDTAVTINFSDTLTGQVDLSVYGKNSCGNGKAYSLAIHLFGFSSASAGVSTDTICETKTYQLNGSASNYKKIEWQTLGDGTFDDSASLTAVYTPGTQDIKAGSVRLVLTAYALLAGGNNASDTLTLHFVKIPVASAGKDDTICENKTYTLQGAAENYSSVVWRTSGDGTFSDSTSLNAVYTPGKADIAADSVVLALQANPLAHCDSVASDNMVLHFVKIPVANAGKDDTICENKSYTLQGTAKNYSSVVWRTSGDGTFSDSTSLNAVYTPGKADIAADLVVLTLKANPLAHCDSVALDNMVLYIKRMPEKPQTPQGPSTILQGTDLTTDYAIPVVKFAKTYTWGLYPVEAGSIAGNDTTGTVTWNSNYTDTEAYVFVTVSNGSCGSVSSDSLKIRLSPLGIPQHPDAKNILVVPNPTSGRIMITMKNNAQDYKLAIINTMGRLVMQKELSTENNRHQFSLDLGTLPAGIYYLRFVNKNGIIIKKVLINK